MIYRRISGCDLLIVASPIYKATYTGVLKVLLDRIPMEGLAGRVAIPVMVARPDSRIGSRDSHAPSSY
jgi:FMN reductase